MEKYNIKKAQKLYAIRVSNKPITKKQRKYIGKILRHQKGLEKNVHVDIINISEVQDVDNISNLHTIVGQVTKNKITLWDADAIIIPEYNHGFIYELLAAQYCPVFVEKEINSAGWHLSYQEFEFRIVRTNIYTD